MTHSFKVHYFHLIWSTKNRDPMIQPELQHRLYEYMGGIIRQFGGKLIEIGGIEDHVHLLIELKQVDIFTDLMRTLKSNSSRWVHANFPHLSAFAWQEGYGSFSVSYSAINNVRKYIREQEVRHKTMSFDDEYVNILNKLRLKYDSRFVLG